MTVRAQPIDGAIDVEAERALTPGCFEVLHLNNAGCALPIHETIGNQIEYLVQEATHGGYETAAGRLEDLDRLYSSAAELLGASSSEIAFTHSATDSWWRAFSAIPLEAGDTVLVGQHEFISGAIALIQAAEAGVVVRAIPNDELGRTDVDALANLIDDSVKLICITQYPMTNGLVNPAAEVGKLAKECGAFYLLDACQAVGQTPVDVAELGCDFLAATGRKWLRGPRGTGLLFASQAAQDRLADIGYFDGRSANWTRLDSYEIEPTAVRFEGGEQSFVAKLGLTTAIDHALGLGLDNIEAAVRSNADYLRNGLASIPNISINDQGDPADRSGIVTFTAGGFEPGELVEKMRNASVNLAAPMARTSRADLERTGLERVVRASPHYYNTAEEIDAAVSAIGKVVA